MTADRDLTVPEIVRRLAAAPVRLCNALGIDGVVRRHEYQGLATRQGGIGDSFSIRLDGPKQGVWHHFAGSAKGDALDLVAYRLQTDKPGAVKWAKDWLGLSGAAAAPPPPLPVRDPEADRRAIEQETERKRVAALTIWDRAREPYGTLAETYLRHRGYHGKIPTTIRFHPGLRHPERDDRHTYPCLIAARTDVERRIRGIWRIYLGRDGQKLGGVEKNKLGLGRVPGGAVRLSPLATCINVAEGIETGLMVYQRISDACVWAALATEFLAWLEWPAGTQELVIWADFDRRVEALGGKRPGWVAAAKLKERALAGGLRVCIVHPGTGEGTDFADVFKASNHDGK